MKLQTLYEVLDVLNKVETKGKTNLAGLLVAINKIEGLIREEQNNDINTETEPEEA